MAATRKRAKTRRSTPKGRARGSVRSRRRGGARGLAGIGVIGTPRIPRLPRLNQRGRDVLGLAFVAIGVFTGFVFYGGWDGGRAGHGAEVALGWVLGGARVLT